MKKTISILITAMMIITAVPVAGGVVFASDSKTVSKIEMSGFESQQNVKTASKLEQNTLEQNTGKGQEPKQEQNLGENPGQTQEPGEDPVEPEPEPVKPARVKLLSAAVASSDTKTYIKIKWGKVKCDGYKILIAVKKNFKTAKKIYVKKPEATSYNITGLKTGRNYFIKMTAYKTAEGKILYSEKYSNVKAVSLKTGWKKKAGRLFYYIKGKPARGNKRIKKVAYCFNAKGELKGSTSKMWNKVRKQKSKTKKLIAVDTKNNIFCVYHRYKNEWIVQKYWRCSTGKKSTPTIKGVYKVGIKMLHFGENHGYTCWYATQILGDYLIHSGTYYPGSKTKVMDNRMGVNISQGCVRLLLDRAYWVYKKIPKDTTIVTL